MTEGKRSSSTRGKKKKVKSLKETSKEVVLESSPNEMEEKTDDQTEEKLLTVQTETTVSEESPKVHVEGDGSHEPLSELSLNKNEKVSENENAKNEKTAEPLRTRLSDEYVIQCYFDKSQNQFIASVLEFEHVKATGTSKADVIRDCENRLESHLNLMKRQGESFPEPFQTRNYPETLHVPISQGLYRRLDLLSRQEKVSLDQLVIELVSGMVERRLQVPSKHLPQGGGPQRPQHSSQHSQGQGHREGYRDNHRGESRREGHREAPREAHREGRRNYSNEDNIGNLKRDSQQSPNRNNRNNRGGRNFHKTMESRENFLEYVRNLEKGSWKKR